MAEKSDGKNIVWLQDEFDKQIVLSLRELYSDAIAEPLPEDIIGLLKQFEKLETPS